MIDIIVHGNFLERATNNDLITGGRLGNKDKKRRELSSSTSVSKIKKNENGS
jgi:hypothetical protein